MKNPVNAILSAAKVLETGGSKKVPSEKLLRVIVDGAERINGVVSALNTHARPADETDLQAVDVRDGVEATLRLLEHKSRETQIHHELDAVERVRVPARAFNQIFLNLLDNAIRAGAQNIWITVGQRESMVNVAVADDGPGVPLDLVSRIFDPFFTTREQGEGTGLGLHLARRLAHDCGGELRYETRPGGGAEIRSRGSLHAAQCRRDGRGGIGAGMHSTASVAHTIQRGQEANLPGFRAKGARARSTPMNRVLRNAPCRRTWRALSSAKRAGNRSQRSWSTRRSELSAASATSWRVGRIVSEKKRDPQE